MILKKIQSVKPLGLYKLFITFDTGEQFQYDVSEYLSKGIYTSLLEKENFYKVGIDPISNTVTWFNNLDISPVKLYEEYLKTKIPA